MNRHLTDEQLTDWLGAKPDAWSCEHLQQCAECAEEAKQLRASLASFADTVRRKAAASAPQEVLRPLPQSSPVFSRRTLTWAAAAASILLVASLFMFLLSPSKPPQPATQAGETITALQQPAETVRQSTGQTASVRQDPDDVFLMNLQADLQQEVPSALKPALVILSERNQLAQQAMPNSQGENGESR